jgi:hypothetical protein
MDIEFPSLVNKFCCCLDKHKLGKILNLFFLQVKNSNDFVASFEKQFKFLNITK